MGLIRSVDEISKELQKQKKLEQLERLEERKEKKKQQEQKENLKRYKNDLELYLKAEFNQYFTKFGSEYIFEFYDRNRKKEVLEQYFDTIKQIDKNGFETIPYKNELEQHFYNKYNTILTKAQKEQKQQELYNLQQIPIEEETTKQKNNIDIIAIFLIIIKILLGIIFLPVLLIFFIILGCFKYIK